VPTEKTNGADHSASATPALPPAENEDSSTETVRRTRGSAPVRRSTTPPDHSAAPSTRSNAEKKANGHANGSANHAAEADGATSLSSGFVGTNPETRAGSRVNGHDQACSSAPAAPDWPLLPRAGSDDASGLPVAIAEVSTSAGTARSACAELAKGASGKKRRSSENEDGPRVPSEKKEYPPGEGPLPFDPAEFVEEIHQRVDLFEVWSDLLGSEDDKIKQRAVEKLTEMRYKAAASMTEEPQQIIFDLVRPKRED